MFFFLAFEIVPKRACNAFFYFRCCSSGSITTMNKDKVDCKVVSTDTDRTNEEFKCPRHQDGAFEINKLYDLKSGNYQIIEDEGGRVSFRKEGFGVNKDHDYFRVDSTDYCVSTLASLKPF